MAAAAWSCVEKMLQLAQRTLAPRVDQRLDQNRGLDRHVERSGDTHAGQWLRFCVFAADRHQAGHFLLGDHDFFAAPFGQLHIGDFVVGGRCRATWLYSFVLLRIIISINQDILIHSMSVLKSLRLLSDPSRLRLAAAAGTGGTVRGGTAGDSVDGAKPDLDASGAVEAGGAGGGPQAGEEQPLPAERPAAGGSAACGGKEITEAAADAKALQLVLEKRRDKVRGYFDELAGKFGRKYVPGRSWKGLAETLLQLMPPMVIGDLGAGEGTFSQLLAQRAPKVIAVDNSAKMVEFGAKLARENGIANLEYRLGDLESPPIETRAWIWRFSARACIMRCIRRSGAGGVRGC